MKPVDKSRTIRVGENLIVFDSEKLNEVILMCFIECRLRDMPHFVCDIPSEAFIGKHLLKITVYPKYGDFCISCTGGFLSQYMEYDLTKSR